jgi:hypothetical protein
VESSWSRRSDGSTAPRPIGSSSISSRWSPRASARSSSGVEYISSAGLRVMLALAKKMKDARGHVALCAMGEPVKMVFSLAGFLPLFAVDGTRDAAVARVAGP